MSEKKNQKSEKSQEIKEEINAEIELLKDKYLDLLISIPLSYQTHELVAIRNQIAELKKELAGEK